MSISQNNTYIEDIKRIKASIDLSDLIGKRILITGATGLIGSAIVDILLWLNRNEKANITVFAASRKVETVYNRFKGYDESTGLFPIQYDATQSVNFGFAVDYIIHAASNASPDAYLRFPVDTMLSNVLGISELLKYAVTNNVKKTVYVSSSEVYGVQKRSDPIKENEYGITDLLSTRSSYPVGKQSAETLCKCYVEQYGCNVSIVRPGHIYGPTATSMDQRVSSAFARLAAKGQNIVMKSAGLQIRSYCHCLDCATAILKVLTKGAMGEAYNISNKNSIITIRQMAEYLAKHADVLVIDDFPSASEMAAFNPMDNSSLNSEKLEALGWQGEFNADEGLRQTLAVIREELSE